jgi:hypothetical protein
MRRNGHKYGAKRTTVDGISFASQKEARRYQELKLLEKAGEIHGLAVQPIMPLGVPHRFLSREGNTMLKRIGEYRADFLYCVCRGGVKCSRSRLVVEDVKGFKTQLYRWKKKHVEAQYGITIREI